MHFATDTEHPVVITNNEIKLAGIFHLPKAAQGIVIFAHGSGSGRLSPRNQQVANFLQQAGFATLLFDLLTAEEDSIDANTMEYRFDIPLLAKRLLSATRWIRNNPFLNHLPMGYFGASTGAGAALLAAAEEKEAIKAVVSRGGRPDLAGDKLTEVAAATLLIVGENDEVVIDLNEQAFALLQCQKKLHIIPGATHLFEEPGKLQEVSELAKNWFMKYLI